MTDHIGEYRDYGYAIVRGVFAPVEIARIGAAMDQVYAEGVAHGRSFRHGNLFYNVTTGPDGRPHVPMAQWPSYHQRVLDETRTDPRYLEILRPLIGNNLKQIINQLHWKLPHSRGDFAWHQDSRFRRPDSAYRNLGSSYVQTGLAIDPHNPATGGMRFIPGSRRKMPRWRLPGSIRPRRSTWCSTPEMSPCGTPISSTPRDSIHPTTCAGSTSTAMSAPRIAIAANGRFATGSPCRLAHNSRWSITKTSSTGPNRIT